MGLLQGRYYDADGNPTEELTMVHQRIESYEVIKKQKDEERRKKREAAKAGRMMMM